MFSLEIENCIKLALRSVTYGQANELTEIIHFIVEANKFGIRGSERGVRELFKVVWRRDNAVKEIIINAARDLFISANKFVFILCSYSSYPFWKLGKSFILKKSIFLFFHSLETLKVFYLIIFNYAYVQFMTEQNRKTI